MDIRQAWNLFLYAGVEKEEYHRLIPAIREQNRALLKVFSQIAAVMFLLLFIASEITSGFATRNSTTYVLCALEMLVVLFCTHFILPKHPALIMPMVYVFEILLYAFGIHVSLLHAERPAVSAVAFLLVSPLLFYDRPVRLSALIAVVVALFCGIVLRLKTPDVAESDVWNMITFGLLAIAVTVFTMSTKIQALSRAGQVQYLSQTDLLTGVKNRNYYEERLQSYLELSASNLICVYADVNGLHEMNNRYGHPAGDRMLREVAETMQRHFGHEHTYRVGGDEFIAFRVDGEPEDLALEIGRMKQALDQKGYHVSFGSALREKDGEEMNMRELVGEAESNMFAAKREFYMQSGNDRRGR